MTHKKKLIIWGKELTPSSLCALAAAVLLLVMTLGQLFSFEEMPGIASAWQLPLLSDVAALTVASLAVLQVIALPALIGMSLPIWLRRISSWAGWLVIGFWLAIASSLSLSGATVNSGILGEKLPVEAGASLWVIVLILATLRVSASIVARRGK